MSFAIAIAALSVGWERLQAAAEETKENAARIKVTEDQLTIIKTNQAVIQNQLKNLSEKSETFRDDTKEDLGLIIRLLDPRVGPPR